MKSAVKMGSWASLALVSSLAVACGGSSEIAGDRDPLVSGHEGKDEPAKGSGGNDGNTSSNPDDPVTDDGKGGGGTVAPEPLPDTPACKKGVPQKTAGAKCDFIVQGHCFSDSTVACECAGCSGDKCLILESYPAQPRCQK